LGLAQLCIFGSRWLVGVEVLFDAVYVIVYVVVMDVLQGVVVCVVHAGDWYDAVLALFLFCSLPTPLPFLLCLLSSSTGQHR